MELAFNWFVSAFTAIILSFVVAKLVSMAVSDGDASAGNVSSTGVDNGEEQKGKLEKRAASKTKKRRSKKISSNAILDSEPVKISGGFSKADDIVDECKAIEIPEGGVEFAGVQKRDDYFGLDDASNKEALTNQANDRVLNTVHAQNEENVMGDEEDWEGIERNELEKDFVKAMNYVKEARMNKLGSDVVVQFHDLQKVVMEGPCKTSNRAKWNSWQKSGSMNPEEAMEKYITLLSDKVPGWIDDHPYNEE